MVLSELSYNSTTDDSDAENANGDHKSNKSNKSTNHKPPKHFKTVQIPRSAMAPNRRMTFGGLRSDTKGEVFNAHRRPSFLETLKKQAVDAAVVATKATRRLSITGNNGQGFELVAIGVRLMACCFEAHRPRMATSSNT